MQKTGVSDQMHALGALARVLTEAEFPSTVVFLRFAIVPECLPLLGAQLGFRGGTFHFSPYGHLGVSGLPRIVAAAFQRQAR